ncbi:TRAFAC clade GTPase domain-containing protein [Mycobacterium sp. NPDC050041]|uniref:TRAFAC clade GTPase domain-containing protein n=1 Tax=Mycobacterium sp. NPDC050041 TaxID=3364293 RepID=UPI003C2B1014
MPFVVFVLIVIGIAIAVYAVWTAAVALLKLLSLLVYVIPVVAAVAVVAGAVFSLLTTSWVLWGGGSPLPLVRDPNKVVAKEVFRREPTGPSKAYGWDWAWPSYLPYQISEDAKAVYATQIGLIAGYWRAATVRINAAGAVTSGIKMAAIRVVGFVGAGFAFACFWVGVAITSALTAIAMSILFAVAMLVRWSAIYGLRGLDAAYRTVRRSSAKCPECYEPTTLPSFECPDAKCGHVHRDIRPGRLGVVVRRCGCGTALPTTVVRASLAKLRARCPYCDAYLSAGAGSRRTIQVPVFGTTNSGKTRFMLAATVGLAQTLSEQGGSLAGTTPTSQSKLEDASRLIAQRANTVRTDAALPQAFGLLATPAEGRPVELHLFDAAGELFDKWNTSANLRYLESAEAMVFVIDPLSTQAAKASLNRVGGEAVPVGSGSPADSYDSAIEYLRAANADLKNKTLAVVLTKADVLLTLPVAGDLQAGDESSIHQWLTDHDLDALMDRTRLDFKSVKYFVADSLNSTQPSSPVSPFRPLAWLLREVKANVLRPEAEQSVTSPAAATGTNADWGRP